MSTESSSSDLSQEGRTSESSLSGGFKPSRADDVFYLIARAAYIHRLDDTDSNNASPNQSSGSLKMAGSSKSAVGTSGMKPPDALRSLSLVSVRWRHAALPFLMRTVRIAGDWNECADALVGLLKMKVVRHTRHFTLDVKLGEKTVQRRPSPAMPAQLSHLLASMHHLKHLNIDMPSYYAPLFGAQLRQDKVQHALKRVRTVCMGPYCEFAIQVCANVEQVTAKGKWLLDTKMNPATHLFRTIHSSLMLHTLELNTDWTLPLVSALLNSLPLVRRLALEGDINLPLVLSTLAKFQKLHELKLSDTSHLHLDLKRRSKGSAHKVASLCGMKLPVLNMVTIGDETFAIERTLFARFLRSHRCN